ncbi:MAG TPA: hypothetical protein VKW78_10255 [Terriglobales bacterium]|nr:hypothetical protein [Terriglobales bacterium]
MTGGIPLEDALQYRRSLRIDLDATSNGIVFVAEGSTARIDSLFSLFAHPFLHFFPQVLRVVLGHGHVNVVHEFVLRTRVLGNHPAFFYEVNFDVAGFDQFLEGDAVGAIAIQAVGLFDQHDAATIATFQQLPHLPELLAAGVLGRFHIDEFLLYAETAHARVFVQQFALRGNRVTLAFLLAAGNAGVDHCTLHTFTPLRLLPLCTNSRSQRSSVRKNSTRVWTSAALSEASRTKCSAATGSLIFCRSFSRTLRFSIAPAHELSLCRTKGIGNGVGERVALPLECVSHS